MPIITVIMVGSIVASNNEKLSSGYNLFEWLSVLIGMVVLSFVGLQILQNYRSFASIQTLIGFLLPLILSLCFIPFMYLAALYSHYEEVFNRLRRDQNKSEELIRYAKKQIFNNCLFSLGKLKRVLDLHKELINIETEGDVDEFVRRLK